MRFLAVLLLLPWLLILCWAYWNYPKSLPRTSARRIADFVGLLLSLVAAVICAELAFTTAELPVVDEFGRNSGGIWQQVLPALYGYGAFTAVLMVAMLVRYLVWGRRR